MNIHELIADLALKIVTPSTEFHYGEPCSTCKETEETFLKACREIETILESHGITCNCHTETEGGN